MAQIKIYSNLASGKITFDGSTVKEKNIGSVVAEAHPTLSDRVVIKSNILLKRGSETEFREFFKRLNINRIQNESGETLVDAPYNYDRDQILAYLDVEFTKPTITEYFEYDASTDRLQAKKDIEVNKNGFFLGSTQTYTLRI
jgi:hypothetical protein